MLGHLPGGSAQRRAKAKAERGGASSSSILMHSGCHLFGSHAHCTNTALRHHTPSYLPPLFPPPFIPRVQLHHYYPPRSLLRRRLSANSTLSDDAQTKMASDSGPSDGAPPPAPARAASPSTSFYALSDDEEGEYNTITHAETGRGVKLLFSKSKVSRIPPAQPRYPRHDVINNN